ncbi:MAG: twin-arginine translocase TatA/TatE family subunit [Sphingomicrobium sp.]
MGSFSLIHWIILGLFLLLLFGGNRFSNMMKDVAKGMKSFKEGMADDEEEKRKRFEEQRRGEGQRQLPRDQEPIDVTARRDEPAATPPRDDEAR